MIVQLIVVKKILLPVIVFVLFRVLKKSMNKNQPIIKPPSSTIDKSQVVDGKIID
jgi:hypothetical protein